jgi:hypothetical protein
VVLAALGSSLWIGMVATAVSAKRTETAVSETAVSEATEYLRKVCRVAAAAQMELVVSAVFIYFRCLKLSSCERL